MSKKKRKKRWEPPKQYVEVEKYHGVWDDYLEYGPQCDTVNDCPIIPGDEAGSVR